MHSSRCALETNWTQYTLFYAPSKRIKYFPEGWNRHSPSDGIIWQKRTLSSFVMKRAAFFSSNVGYVCAR